MSYAFKYRLSQKSSLATIATAVRALGYSMSLEKGGFDFGWYKDAPGALRGNVYQQHFELDENVPEWLNGRLEAAGLLKPLDPEP